MPGVDGGVEKVRVRVRVNGRPVEAEVPANMLLVHFLREVAGVKSVHVGCDTSHCGACTVVLNGRAVKSCTLFAFMADGGEILTLEGLSGDGGLHPLQQAFHEEHALQCGFCTPGIIMTLYDYFSHGGDASDEGLRRALEGNLCRCTGYVNILRAARKAAARLRIPRRSVGVS